MTISARDIQRLLAAAGYYKGDIDGDLGPKSSAAIHSLLDRRKNELPASAWNWSTWRKGVAALQLILLHAGYTDVGTIDGLVGPSTEYALGLFDYEKAHGKRPDAWRPAPEAEPELDLLTQGATWPLQSQASKAFGVAGGPQCTAGVVKLPFKMKIAWDTASTIETFRCHEKVATSIERVLGRIASAYSPEAIAEHGFNLYGGCFNYRQMRGGSSLSTHAWGIAIDFDPARNQLKWGRDRAYLARKDCENFFRCWEAEGWLSLGRARNYDWMHVQAARLG